MIFRTFLSILVAVSITFLELSEAYILHFKVERYNETVPVKEKNHIKCLCNGRTRSAKLGKHVLEKMFKSLQNHKFCAEDVSYDSRYCNWFQECQKCTGLMESCTAIPSPGVGYNCTKETFRMQEKFLVTLNSTYGNFKHHMQRRQTAVCIHPTELKTASLSITKYPSFVRAKQDCIFGYTLKEGISREMRCSFAENKWTPSQFEECSPFVDCNVKLILPGSMNCFTATPLLPPTCNITCHGYEDKPAVPPTKYECKVNGGWQPKLPHCTASGTGIDLAPAPRVRLHPPESVTDSQKAVTKDTKLLTLSPFKRKPSKKQPKKRKLDV